MCPDYNKLALDPLGFGLPVVSGAEPWESVKDASAGSAQAAGFPDPAAVCKGYELPSTGSGQASGFMKGAGWLGYALSADTYIFLQPSA